MKQKIVYRKAIPFGEIKDRRELLRIVKTHDGSVMICNDYSIKGRSVYLLKDIKIVPIIKKKKIIERNLRLKTDCTHIYDEIENIFKQ